MEMECPFGTIHTPVPGLDAITFPSIRRLDSADGATLRKTSADKLYHAYYSSRR